MYELYLVQGSILFYSSPLCLKLNFSPFPWYANISSSRTLFAYISAHWTYSSFFWSFSDLFLIFFWSFSYLFLICLIIFRGDPWYLKHIKYKYIKKFLKNFLLFLFHFAPLSSSPVTYYPPPNNINWFFPFPKGRRRRRRRRRRWGGGG